MIGFAHEYIPGKRTSYSFETNTGLRKNITIAGIEEYIGAFHA